MEMIALDKKPEPSVYGQMPFNNSRKDDDVFQGDKNEFPLTMGSTIFITGLSVLISFFKPNYTRWNLYNPWNEVNVLLSSSLLPIIIF